MTETKTLLTTVNRAAFNARGLRWTPQRRTILDVLARTSGHITGAELVDQCRQLDPETTPSTVYRTLDVLEELGVVRHSHGRDGREEYHVLPEVDHGHLVCEACGATWEISGKASTSVVRSLERESGFTIDTSHIAISGICPSCRAHATGGSSEPTAT